MTQDAAARLHDESLVFLSFVSSHARFLPDGRVDASVFLRDEEGIQCSLPLLRRGGVDAFMLSFGVGANELFPGKAGVGRLFQLLSTFLDTVRDHSEQMSIATDRGEVERVVAEGKTAVMLHLIGTRIDGDLSVLEGYRRLGVRALHGPFDERHPEAGNVEATSGPLTPFGRDAVKAIDQLGMRVDVSHSSDEAFWEILDLVEGPVIASHSNCRALCDVARNLTDEQIEAVGKQGGVIGIHFASGFIEREFMDAFRATGFYERLREWESELRRKYPDPFEFLAKRFDPEGWVRTDLHAMQKQVPLPRLTKLVDHVDRMVEIAGIDHVGIGTDYTLGSIPRELDPADQLPNLTRALVERGYTEEDVRKIWSANFMRVFG